MPKATKADPTVYRGQSPAPLTHTATSTPFEENNRKVAEVKRRIVPPSSTRIPHIAELTDWDANELQTVIDAMDETIALREVVDEAEKRMKELKDSLTGIAIGYDVKQFCTDTVKVTVTQQSRTTLNKTKLLEHIPASILDTCYETGAEFYTTKVEAIKSKA